MVVSRFFNGLRRRGHGRGEPGRAALVHGLLESSVSESCSIVASIPTDRAAGERARLQDWLKNYPDWNAVQGERFRPWVDLVRRVSFDEDGAAPSPIVMEKALAAVPPR